MPSPSDGRSLDLSGRNVDPLADVVAAWTAGTLVREPVRGSDDGLTESRVRWPGRSPADAPDLVLGHEIAIALAPGDAVYGGGESFRTLDLRGHRRVLVNRETHGAAGADLAYCNVPFFWSDAGWGLLLHTGAPVLADVGASDSAVARFLVLGAATEKELLRGPPASLLAACAERTGRPGDWPDWGFAPWMSRASYLSAAEVHATLDELEAAGCPVGVIHVDAWLAGNVFREFTTNWTPDRARFPAGWTDGVRARGVRVSLWLNPYVLAGSALGNELAARGLLLRTRDGRPAATPDRVDRWLVDFTHPGAVAWWQSRIRALLAEERPDALKLDFGEEVPLDAVCHDGRQGIDVRNGYAALYQRATADAVPPERRPLPFFCRAGSLGAQTTPCHWVGDTPSTWSAMAGALTACLSLSLSGVPLVSHDAGGFAAPKTDPTLSLGRVPAELLDIGAHAADERVRADVDPELFGRWAQWAACSPVTRFHGIGRREPTAYPEPWRSAAIRALRFREGVLRPLLRAAYAESQATGLPMVRPPALTHPGHPDARRATHQYLLGPDLLVAPVLEPGGVVDVWFPPDAEWVPLLDAPAPRGPGWQRIVVAPDAFPVYMRRRP